VLSPCRIESASQQGLNSLESRVIGNLNPHVRLAR
jgi:hypothetical protein